MYQWVCQLNDIGRNFAGTVSGWMNLWGNIGALLSPFLVGALVASLGWTMTFQLLIIPKSHREFYGCLYHQTNH